MDVTGKVQQGSSDMLDAAHSPRCDMRTKQTRHPMMRTSAV